MKAKTMASSTYDEDRQQTTVERLVDRLESEVKCDATSSVPFEMEELKMTTWLALRVSHPLCHAGTKPLT